MLVAGGGVDGRGGCRSCWMLKRMCGLCVKVLGWKKVGFEKLKVVGVLKKSYGQEKFVVCCRARACGLDRGTYFTDHRSVFIFLRVIRGRGQK
jgi:hypothetical protein